MNVVKCPNPSCPFQFDAALVPPGAVIACPQCRLQFQLPPPPPEPEFLQPEEPAEPAPAERPGRRREGTRGEKDRPAPAGRKRGTPSSDPPPRKGNAAALIAVVVVGFVFICGGGVVGVLLLFGAFKKPASNTSPYTYPEYTLSYQGPGDGWEEDKATRDHLRMNLACFKHASPEGYIAVRAVKTEGAASKADLLPAVRELLNNKDNFEDVDEELTPTEAKFLGGTAERYEFLGVYKKTETGCRGEVHAVAVGTLKVWVYCWAERDRFAELAPAFEKFRAGFKVESKGGETKIQRQVKDFRTPAGLYQLTDTEGLWQEQKDPKSQDPEADLWLAGFQRSAATGRSEAKASANLVVARLKPDADAKKHILEQFNYGGGDVLNDLAGDPLGDAPSGGPVEASAEVVRFTKKDPNASTADKLIVYKVVDVAGERVVAYAACHPKQASYWEQRLMLLVGTLKGLK
jgi:hypothetical protein